jgi:hypothetical protein
VSLPEQIDGKRLYYTAKSLIVHPQLQDSDGNPVRLVRVDTVALLDHCPTREMKRFHEMNGVKVLDVAGEWYL